MAREAVVADSRVGRTKDKVATWWWDAGRCEDEPACAVEAALAHLLQLAGGRRAGIIGGEWWVQHRYAPGPPIPPSHLPPARIVVQASIVLDSHLRAMGCSVPGQPKMFHFDVDQERQKQDRTMRAPGLSSILFLTATGGPTVRPALRAVGLSCF